MKKILITILQYVVFFGLGALLIWWQYGKLTPQDKVEIFAAFHQARSRWWILIPVFVISLLSHIFRAMRWKLLLEPLQLKPSTVNISFAVLIGYLVNLLVPRMGEVARCSVLAKYEDEPVDKIVGTIVAERSFDMICLLLITVATFLLQMDIASEYLAEQMAKLSMKGGSITIAIVGLILMLFALVFFYRKYKDSKVGKFIKGLGEGITSIFKMKKRVLFLFYTVLIWGCYLWLVVIGFKAISATEHLGWLPALSVLVFGSVGMIATPGGIGAYPPVIQVVLVKLYAVKGSFALAFGWLSWSVQTVVVLVFGLISLLLLPIYNSKKHGQTSVDTK